MKHSLAKKKFRNRKEVQFWVSKFFESQPAEFFKEGIHFLRGRWRDVIDANGEIIFWIKLLLFCFYNKICFLLKTKFLIYQPNKTPNFANF